MNHRIHRRPQMQTCLSSASSNAHLHRKSLTASNKRLILGKTLYFCPIQGCKKEDIGTEQREEFISHIHTHHKAMQL